MAFGSDRSRKIRLAQRQSSIARELAMALIQIAQDDPELVGLTITNTSLSSDGITCTVYLHGPGGLTEFEQKRKQLVLYLPSFRSVLAKSLCLRRVPKIRFVYDAQLDKEQRLNDFMDSLKKDDPDNEHEDL